LSWSKDWIWPSRCSIFVSKTSLGLHIQSLIHLIIDNLIKDLFIFCLVNYITIWASLNCNNILRVIQCFLYRKNLVYWNNFLVVVDNNIPIEHTHNWKMTYIQSVISFYVTTENDKTNTTTTRRRLDNDCRDLLPILWWRLQITLRIWIIENKNKSSSLDWCRWLSSFLKQKEVKYFWIF